MPQTDNQPDRDEQIKRLAKYLLQWTAIAVAAKMIPSQPLQTKEVMMIAVVGTITFSLLDLYAPAVSQGVKDGVGFALGINRL